MTRVMIKKLSGPTLTFLSTTFLSNVLLYKACLNFKKKANKNKTNNIMTVNSVINPTLPSNVIDPFFHTFGFLTFFTIFFMGPSRRKN
jgi:hypothetical protein